MRRLPSAVLAALLLAACGQPGPTWHGEIAPIVERSCSGCHAFDERTAPRQAQRMLARVEAGEMPPYLPGPGSLPFANDPRLSAGELALLRAWAADPELGTPRPRVPEPATVYETEPYQATGERDEVHCFVLHPAPGRVVGYHWIGVGAHHFSADVIAAKDVPRLPGRRDWDCTAAASGVPAKAALNSTAPGAPFAYPAGYGVELAPGDALLLYAHLVPSDIRAPSRYGIALKTTDQPIRPALSYGWSAPAELKCPPSVADQPQCSLADAERRQVRGDGVPDPAEHIARCGAQTFGPESDGRYPITSGCSANLPPGQHRLLGVRAHTHALGTALRVTSGGRTLLSIPRWDYRFEQTYVPAEPVTVAGSARCECEWDNGTAQGTPQRVLFGLGKSDNMCVCSLELANE